MKKSVTVIIPAAGQGKRMSEVMLSGRYHIPKALLEIGRTPVIIEIIRSVQDYCRQNAIAVSEIRIVINRNQAGNNLRTFLRSFYGRSSNIKLYIQDNMDGPLAGIRAAGPVRGPVLIWLCDTLVVKNFPMAADTVYTRRVRDDFSIWCLAKIGRDKNIIGFLDKPADYDQASGHALIGVNYLSRGELFYQASRQIIRAGIKIDNEYQISSALDIYRIHQPLRIYELADWMDVGNYENYLKAKEAHLEHLHEHKISLDCGRAVSKRNVRSDEKMEKEYRWYVGAARHNHNLNSFLPGSIGYRDGALTLDYKDWPSLTDWYLYRSLYLPEISRQVFDDFLETIKKRLHIPPLTTPSLAEIKKHNYAMLAEKVLRRLRSFSALCQWDLRLDGEHIGSWRELKPKYLDLADKYSHSRREDWRLIHGDLVFSNILSDGKGGHIFIDPRGEYGGIDGIYGDRYYDLAKISQCLHSHYDHLKKGNYRLGNVGAEDYALEIPVHKHQLIWRRSFDRFCQREHIDRDRLAFFEISLLLSLLPFHKEDRKFTQAVFALALKKLNRL